MLTHKIVSGSKEGVHETAIIVAGVVVGLALGMARTIPTLTGSEARPAPADMVEQWEELEQDVDINCSPSYVVRPGATDKATVRRLPGHGPSVVLTEYIVKELSVGERNEIVAHELTHLERGHTRIRGVMSVVLLAALLGMVSIGSTASIVFCVVAVLAWCGEVLREESVARQSATELAEEHPVRSPTVA